MVKIFVTSLIIMSVFGGLGGYSHAQSMINTSADSMHNPIKNAVRNVYELDQDSTLYLWHGGDVIFFYFTKGKVYFDFSVSCGYWYKTQITDSRTIVFYWDLNEDCTYDMGMKKTFGLSQSPVAGEPFGEFVLVNDSLLKVNYYYPRWVAEMNRYRNAEVFPSMFILDTRVFNKNSK